MHPRVFLDSFWRNDIKNEVFIAMSFDRKYDGRWNNIFVPAIEGVKILGKELKAVRVDIRKSGDSIISEINNGIAHSQIIIADISVIGKSDDEMHHRNGNVMYEVGLALAFRQPVEVILLRDDDAKLIFDLSHIPVHKFNANDIDTSIGVIRKLIIDRISERNLIKDLRFTKVIESLGQFEINLIRSNAHLNILGWRGPSYPPAIATALPRVLEAGILRLEQLAKEDNPDMYVWTTFGRAVADFILKG
jgi:hypothetical protein